MAEVVKKRVDGTPAIQGWEGADRALGEIRALEAEVKTLEGRKQEELRRIQEKHDVGIQPKVERIGLLAKGLEEFAEFHRGDLGAQKSRKLNHGLVGFRLGNPALKTLPKFTWDKVLTCLKNSRLGSRFVRVKEEVAKDAIQSANLSESELKDFGCRMVQEERFFYEVKADSTVSTGAA